MRRFACGSLKTEEALVASLPSFVQYFYESFYRVYEDKNDQIKHPSALQKALVSLSKTRNAAPLATERKMGGSYHKRKNADAVLEDWFYKLNHEWAQVQHEPEAFANRCISFHRVLVLSGGSGVGKHWLIRYFCAKYDVQYFNVDILQEGRQAVLSSLLCRCTIQAGQLQSACKTKQFPQLCLWVLTFENTILEYPYLLKLLQFSDHCAFAPAIVVIFNMSNERNNKLLKTLPVPSLVVYPFWFSQQKEIIRANQREAESRFKNLFLDRDPRVAERMFKKIGLRLDEEIRSGQGNLLALSLSYNLWLANAKKDFSVLKIGPEDSKAPSSTVDWLLALLHHSARVANLPNFVFQSSTSASTVFNSPCEHDPLALILLVCDLIAELSACTLQQHELLTIFQGLSSLLCCTVYQLAPFFVPPILRIVRLCNRQSRIGPGWVIRRYFGFLKAKFDRRNAVGESLRAEFGESPLALSEL